MDIVYFGVIDWYRIRQRPQHLAAGLSANHRVLYVSRESSLLDLLVRVAGISAKKAKYRYRLLPELEKIDDDLLVFSPPMMLPFGQQLSCIDGLNCRMMARLSRRYMAKAGFSCDILWLSLPTHVEAIREFDAGLVIYDRMDNYPDFYESRRRSRIEEKEEELLEKADIVLVTSSGLIPPSLKGEGKVHLVPNAVDSSIFRESGSMKVPDVLRGIIRPIIGYVGYIGKWVDLEMVARVASRHPEWSFVFAGPIHRDVRQAEKLDNVHFPGMIAYEDVPGYIAAFDACIIPFVRNSITDRVNPVKLFEYVAMNRPVIAARTDELKRYEEYCHLYEDEYGLESLIESIVEDGGRTLREELDASMEEFVQANTWDGRVKQIEEIIAERTGGGRRTP